MLRRICLQKTEYLLGNTLEYLLRFSLRICLEVFNLALELLFLFIERLYARCPLRFTHFIVGALHLFAQCLNFVVKRLELRLPRSELGLQRRERLLRLGSAQDCLVEIQHDYVLGYEFVWRGLGCGGARQRCDAQHKRSNSQMIHFDPFLCYCWLSGLLSE